MRNWAITLVVLLCSVTSWATAPSKMVLQNQFGEVSINVLQGSVMPISPSGNIIIMSGASSPTSGGSGTGVNVAGKGSFYIAKDTGALYIQQGAISSPTWTIVNNATIIAAVLTGFTAGAGTVSASDTILTSAQKFAGNILDLQKGKFTPTTETVSAAGAISTTVMETTVSNASGSTYAATLAAPSSQDGQLKVIKMGTATHTVTVAMTNISTSGAYTPTGTTTLTFTSVGDSAVFMAVGAKWVYLGGSAVAS